METVDNELKEVDIDKVFEILEAAREPKSELLKFMEECKDPYLVLICSIVRVNTNDKVAYKAVKKMLKLASTPEKMMDINEDKLIKILKPVNYGARKAGEIVDLSRVITIRFKGKVPNTISRLCKFRGVGRKTANTVLAFGFGKPGIAVDSYVQRVFNRMGYINTKKTFETEMVLREILPTKYWMEFDSLLIRHAHRICKHDVPKCNTCIIREHCNKII